MSSRLYQLAVKAASEAINFDSEGNRELAISKYLQAFDLLMALIRHTDNKRLKQFYAARAEEYLSRAYELKTEIKPINTFKQWYYRGKMEFTFFDNNEVICGLHSKLKKGTGFDVTECGIFSNDCNAIICTYKQRIIFNNETPATPHK